MTSVKSRMNRKQRLSQSLAEVGLSLDGSPSDGYKSTSPNAPVAKSVSSVFLKPPAVVVTEPKARTEAKVRTSDLPIAQPNLPADGPSGQGEPLLVVATRPKVPVAQNKGVICSITGCNKNKVLIATARHPERALQVSNKSKGIKIPPTKTKGRGTPYSGIAALEEDVRELETILDNARFWLNAKYRQNSGGRKGRVGFRLGKTKLRPHNLFWPLSLEIMRKASGLGAKISSSLPQHYAQLVQKKEVSQTTPAKVQITGQEDHVTFKKAVVEPEKIEISRQVSKKISDFIGDDSYPSNQKQVKSGVTSPAEVARNVSVDVDVYVGSKIRRVIPGPPAPVRLSKRLQDGFPSRYATRSTGILEGRVTRSSPQKVARQLNFK